jgi:UDP-N-acetylglucosamine 2-epimerase
VRILSIVGSRPQLLASTRVSFALRDRGLDEMLVHAGLEDPELQLPSTAYRLETGSGTAGEETGRLLPAIEAALLDERPDCVVVFGDTNSTLAGALAAVKLLLPVAHVEAGLRSFDRSSPEELNRVLVDRISTLRFCPTEAAVQNLAGEGITEGVHLVGDVMNDAKAAAKIADLLVYDEAL